MEKYERLDKVLSEFSARELADYICMNDDRYANDLLFELEAFITLEQMEDERQLAIDFEKETEILQ